MHSLSLGLGMQKAAMKNQDCPSHPAPPEFWPLKGAAAMTSCFTAQHRQQYKCLKKLMRIDFCHL